MCRDNTAGAVCAAMAIAGTFLLSGPIDAQIAQTPDWRRIGNAAVELSLASPASGPMERVWYSEDGSRLYARTRSGLIFVTADFETWRNAPEAVVPGEPASTLDSQTLPQKPSLVRAYPTNPSRLYALASSVFRSDDGGRSWANLTAFGRFSIIGDGMTDIAISPKDQDEVVVANESGLWRSLDGGITWAGLNEGLPNLPLRSILALPSAGSLRVLAEGIGVIEWAPGEKQSWKPVIDGAPVREAEARTAASEAVHAQITAVSRAGDTGYAGSSDGRIWYTLDDGETWSEARKPASGPVQSFYVDPKDSRLALAALGDAPQGSSTRLLRTIDGGFSWDDITSDLPDVPVHAVAADTASQSVYAATDAGLFMTRIQLVAAESPSQWIRVGGLPEAPVVDVKLDAGGNQLFAAVAGYGVHAALAPHRTNTLKIVNAADFSSRAAAPGSLLTVLGGTVTTAQAQSLNFPVLASSESESQIQVPFEISGNFVSLLIDAGQGPRSFGLPLRGVSPAIFVDRDGAPLVLNADTGLLLDSMNPVRSNGRLQVLVTGLGKVRPDWPTGAAAPLENPPTVIAPVHAYLDGTPLEVTRAVLAPGYIGFYLVEVQLPTIVNRGLSELYLEAEGQQSNRVRIHFEP